ncbi:MAG: methyltransferase [Planctomycetota bacterium]|nr:methyltransferase [Planctomycetota bacterium]
MARRWTADEILNMVRAFQPASVLAAAAELDIFSALAAHPMTAKSLSTKLGTDIRATTVLLDALTAMGLLTKQGDKYSVPSDVAKILTEESPDNVLPAILHQANGLRRWNQLARITQTGKPARCKPSIRGRAADEAAFIGAMDNFSAPFAESIVKRLKPDFKHLLDIGGASGTWTIAFLHSVPNAKATLFDLPAVIPLAKKRIAKAGLTKRVIYVAGDYYRDELPVGADFAWLSAITHQNSREQNRALFAKIYSALQDNGVLVIRDVVMDSSRTSPVAGAMFAVTMLVATQGGGTYAFDEFRQDLSEAGFTKVKLVHRDQFMNSLIQATKTKT